MKYKKLVIILSVIVGVVALGFLLSYTLFTIHNVELNFKNQTTMFVEENDKQHVINSAKFNYGVPIFSINKKQITENIEKKNPYIKVINIETNFPNKLTVHVAEREETFAIKIGEDAQGKKTYAFCDDELKVLYINKLDKYESLQSNAIILNGLDVVNNTAEAGDFLSLEDSEDIIKNITTAFAYNNRSIADLKGMFKQIDLTYEMNFYTKRNEAVLTLKTFDNFDIKIDLPSHHLIEKFNFMISVIPESVSKYKNYRLVLAINPENPSDTDFEYEYIGE